MPPAEKDLENNGSAKEVILVHLELQVGQGSLKKTVVFFDRTQARDWCQQLIDIADKRGHRAACHIHACDYNSSAPSPYDIFDQLRTGRAKDLQQIYLGAISTPERPTSFG